MQDYPDELISLLNNAFFHKFRSFHSCDSTSKEKKEMLYMLYPVINCSKYRRVFIPIYKY